MEGFEYILIGVFIGEIVVLYNIFSKKNKWGSFQVYGYSYESFAWWL